MMMDTYFWIQLVLALYAFVGVLFYRHYLKARTIATQNGNEPEKSHLLYLNIIVGIPTAWIWMVMPFLKQPRFAGLMSFMIDQKHGSSILGLVTGGIGVLIVLFSLISLLLVEKDNMQVTSKNYSSPEALLTQGYYRIIRHPIITFTIFFITGLCLISGAYYTTFFIPVYFLVCHLTALLEEHYILKRKFKEEYTLYEKQVPRYGNAWLAIVFFALFITVVINYVLVDVA